MGNANKTKLLKELLKYLKDCKNLDQLLYWLLPKDGYLEIEENIRYDDTLTLRVWKDISEYSWEIFYNTVLILQNNISHNGIHVLFSDIQMYILEQELNKINFKMP